MRLLRGLLLAAIATALSAPVTVAAETKHTIRFYLGYLNPTGDLTTGTSVDLGEGPVDVDLKAEYDGALGFGADYEYRFTDLIGLDVGLQYYKPKVKFEASALDIDVTEEDTGKFMPLTVGPMFHVARTDKIDFFVGPEVAYIKYGSVSFDTGGSVDLKDEWTFGVRAGIDVMFGGAWMFNANLEYLNAKSKTDFSDGSPNYNLDPKPLILTVGAGYRF